MTHPNNQEWISVTDRLPENGTECLAWKEAKRIGYGSRGYIFSTFENGAFDDVYPNEIVTHWQPLPPPPKSAPLTRLCVLAQHEPVATSYDTAELEARVLARNNQAKEDAK